MQERTCSIEGCDATLYARGWCHKHYKRWLVHGDPYRGPLSDAERFWSKVNKTATCWLWTASTTQGYGQFRWAGGSLAHRFAYQELIGPIPDGMDLDHLCRTPLCVNPSHLEPVTHAENMRRGLFASKTHCPSGHAYSPENTYVRKDGSRRCRACHARSQRRRNRSRSQEIEP